MLRFPSSRPALGRGTPTGRCVLLPGVPVLLAGLLLLFNAGVRADQPGPDPLHDGKPFSADTLTGLVFDEGRGVPLAEVTITLLTGDQLRVVADALTDQWGRFRIAVSAGTYWLVASREGFATSAPQEVRWEEGASGSGQVLLSLRRLDVEVIDVAPLSEGGDEQVRILGRVVDRSNRRPVIDAEVRVAGGPGTLTDENGMFVLRDITPGRLGLTIRHLAYGEQLREFVAEPGIHYRVAARLTEEAIELEGIEVAVASRSWFRQMDDVRTRMRRGLGGTFLLAEELDRRGHPPVAEALRNVTGLKVRRSLYGWDVQVRGCPKLTGSKQPSVYLDGQRVYAPTGGGGSMDILAQLTTLDVEVIEVYKGAASIPAEFSDLGSDCGVIAIWTKRGG